MSATRLEILTLARLAVPAALAQVGLMMMGIVDTMMVGRLGAEELAAVALGDLWIFGTLIGAMGILFGLDPIVSQAHGAGEGTRAGLALQRGIVIALLLSVPLSFVWLLTEPMLIRLGQRPELAAVSQQYANYQLFSAFPMLAFTAMRSYLQGRGILRVILLVILLANILNVILDWALIFGHLGCPPMGVRGAGLATGLGRVFLMVALAAAVRWLGLHHGAWQPWSRRALKPSSLWQVVRVGLPVGIQLVLEIWAFQVAMLFAGRLGATALAAHTIALRLASLSFMFPLGIAIATSARVGNLIGARRHEDAQRVGWIGLAMGAAVMGVAALLLVTLRHQLPRLFVVASTETEVIALAATILPIAATFQIFDGLQVVGGGILRGAGTTRAAALFHLAGFYLLALPLASWLTFTRGWGLRGVWWGLCLGLGTVSALLIAWIHFRGPARLGAAYAGGGGGGPD